MFIYTFQIITFSFTLNLGGRYYYPNSTNEKTEPEPRVQVHKIYHFLSPS